eukprot:scaffold40075_cov18-Tisochrysis_lutea.AAC.2
MEWEALLRRGQDSCLRSVSETNLPLHAHPNVNILALQAQNCSVLHCLFFDVPALDTFGYPFTCAAIHRSPAQRPCCSRSQITSTASMLHCLFPDISALETFGCPFTCADVHSSPAQHPCCMHLKHIYQRSIYAAMPHSSPTKHLCCITYSTLVRDACTTPLLLPVSHLDDTSVVKLSVYICHPSSQLASKHALASHCVAPVLRHPLSKFPSLHAPNFRLDTMYPSFQLGRKHALEPGQHCQQLVSLATSMLSKCFNTSQLCVSNAQALAADRHYCYQLLTASFVGLQANMERARAMGRLATVHMAKHNFLRLGACLEETDTFFLDIAQDRACTALTVHAERAEHCFGACLVDISARRAP